MPPGSTLFTDTFVVIGGSSVRPWHSTAYLRAVKTDESGPMIQGVRRVAPSRGRDNALNGIAKRTSHVERCAAPLACIRTRAVGTIRTESIAVSRASSLSR